jgi:hypothetical protein
MPFTSYPVAHLARVAAHGDAGVRRYARRRVRTGLRRRMLTSHRGQGGASGGRRRREGSRVSPPIASSARVAGLQ